MNKTGRFEIKFHNSIERDKFIALYRDLMKGNSVRSFTKVDNQILVTRFMWKDFYNIKEALGLRKEVVITDKWVDKYGPKIHTCSKTIYVVA